MLEGLAARGVHDVLAAASAAWGQVVTVEVQWPHRPSLPTAWVSPVSKAIVAGSWAATALLLTKVREPRQLLGPVLVLVGVGLPVGSEALGAGPPLLDYLPLVNWEPRRFYLVYLIWSVALAGGFGRLWNAHRHPALSRCLAIGLAAAMAGPTIALSMASPLAARPPPMAALQCGHEPPRTQLNPALTTLGPLDVEVLRAILSRPVGDFRSRVAERCAMLRGYSLSDGESSLLVPTLGGCGVDRGERLPPDVEDGERVVAWWRGYGAGLATRCPAAVNGEQCDQAPSEVARAACASPHEPDP